MSALPIHKATERGAHYTGMNRVTFNIDNIRKMSKEKTNDPEETARKKDKLIVEFYILVCTMWHYYILICYDILSYVVEVSLRYFISYHITSCLVVMSYIISYHIISYHTISYIIASTDEFHGTQYRISMLKENKCPQCHNLFQLWTGKLTGDGSAHFQNAPNNKSALCARDT